MGIIIAIDGPCGSGKGTITKKVQKKLGLVNIDSGSLFRCVTLTAIDNDLDETNVEQILKLLDLIDIQIEDDGEKDVIYLNGIDVSARIRDFDVSTLVSKIAPIIPLRERMLEFQHKLAYGKNVIIEGRDIGTEVFPNADVKIYLDADVNERAKRRHQEYISNGNYLNFDQVLESMKQRDSDDFHRPYGALKQAEDAIYVDSTNMSIDEVVSEIINIIDDKTSFVKDRLDTN